MCVQRISRRRIVSNTLKLSMVAMGSKGMLTWGKEIVDVVYKNAWKKILTDISKVDTHMTP